MTGRILLTNDDGYDAAGLVALRAALIAHGLTTVTIAPLRNRSATGRRVTVGSRLGLYRMDASRDNPVWALDGTPADCARVGLLASLFPDVDVVVSGINHGVNLGDDVSYSGTVAAAAESALLGKPAVAVSQAAAPQRLGFLADRPQKFLAVDFIARLTADLATTGLADGLFLNVNVPAAITGHARLATLGRRAWRQVKVTVHDDDGQTQIDGWAGDAEAIIDDGSDFAAMHAGRIAVTAMSARNGVYGVCAADSVRELIARVELGSQGVRRVR